MKMKNLFMAIAVFGLVGFAVSRSNAQTLGNFGINCDGSYASPIQCGFYTEGYQDGVNDARSNQDQDYKRYRRKFDNQYESAYRAGYERGYATVRPNGDWNRRQEDAYDLGYKLGDDDHDRGISRLPARYEGRYDNAYAVYYRNGYFDGYDQRPKNYVIDRGNGQLPGNPNFPVGNFPGGNNSVIGSRTGTMIWTGRVDQRVNIVIQGNTVRTQTVAGSNLGNGTHTMSGTIPRREADATVRKLDGRGSVNVIQQPNRVNNYTTIVQVYDGNGGAENYRFEVTWQSTNTFDTYSTGKLRWKGRVDQSVNIRISGDDVQEQVLAGRSLTNISRDMQGYLANRDGRVNVRKLKGRGSVTILEQPSRLNNYTAVIRVFDPKSDDDEYEIEVTW
ncbi:MAG: hypothetical protein KDB79_08770 [Acidobacteria bacterium]|nr:hypothetical protein [Acidobacteriota bacterium]